MSRRPLLRRIAPFNPGSCDPGCHPVLAPLSRSCPEPTRQVVYVLLTRAPLYRGAEAPFRVRLACVRHAASVCSEPGSNSLVNRYGRRGNAPLAMIVQTIKLLLASNSDRVTGLQATGPGQRPVPPTQSLPTSLVKDPAPLNAPACAGTGPLLALPDPAAPSACRRPSRSARRAVSPGRNLHY